MLHLVRISEPSLRASTYSYQVVFVTNKKYNIYPNFGWDSKYHLWSEIWEQFEFKYEPNNITIHLQNSDHSPPLTDC